MGVINKLKGRMSGYNALTKGPAKFDDFGFDSEYKPKTSGSDAVAQGLHAGAMMEGPVQEDTGAQIAEVGENLGMALAEGGILDSVGDKRRKSIKASKKAGMTGKEARKKFRADNKAERVANREKKQVAKKIKKYLKDNPLTFRI